MRVLILADQYKDPRQELSHRFSEVLKQQGLEVSELVLPNRALACEDLAEKEEAAQLLLVLGGDGSFLRAAHLALRWDCPIWGINLGSLGFLLQTETEEALRICEDGLSWNEEKLLVSHRSILQLQHLDQKGRLLTQAKALNDIVLTSSTQTRFVALEVNIDGQMRESFYGDGLILSTSSGSTAYALASGGPVVDPILDVMELCPLCPHALHHRPLVLSGERHIQVELTELPSDRYEAQIRVDGEQVQIMKRGESISLSLAKQKLKVISPKGRDNFFELHEKLRRRGEGYRRAHED